MPGWTKQYLVRRSTRILSFAIRQNWEALQLVGEPCYLLKRKARSDATFQWDSRKVSTLTNVASSHQYTIDPDTGSLRYLLWSATYNEPVKYPDIGTLTATVQSSGGTYTWEPAVDKYSFIDDRKEYAFDIYQDQLNNDGTPVADAVYMVFNTPPFTADNTVLLTYGYINPLTNFAAMQPVRDNQPDFQNSLFGFEQWLNPMPKIRKRCSPNAFILAFPNIQSDFTITEGGLLEETKATFWTVPPLMSPLLVEHDVVVRESTGMRYQIINATPIYIESILVSQHFDMSEIDPKSTLYCIDYETGH